MSIQYEGATLTGSYDVVGSFPKSFGYGVEEPDLDEGTATAEKPRILLMGLRRSGKSSIQKVSYHNLESNQTDKCNNTLPYDLNRTSNLTPILMRRLILFRYVCMHLSIHNNV